MLSESLNGTLVTRTFTDHLNDDLIGQFRTIQSDQIVKNGKSPK